MDGVASASSTYQPRRPERGALHQLVRDHFETFRAQAAHLRDGQGLPRFVEQAAFAPSPSATASFAVALAEAGVPRLPDVRMSGGGLRRGSGVRIADSIGLCRSRARGEDSARVAVGAA